MPEIEVADSDAAPATLRDEILTLCNAAYQEDLSVLFPTFGLATHVLGRRSGRIVSHAMRVTRWLQPGKADPLKAAYVEMGATHPQHQGQGYATAVMRAPWSARFRTTIDDYELAALCPATEMG